MADTHARSTTQHATTLLAEDHKAVKKLFRDFEKLRKDEGAPGDQQALVKQICTELAIHARIEEELFYPALREALKEADLLDEAAEEHAGIRNLVEELKTMQPGDGHYAAKITVLSEYVDHHVKEEQDQLFPQARKAGLDKNDLGERLMHRKQELQESPELLEQAPPGARQGARGRQAGADSRTHR